VEADPPPSVRDDGISAGEIRLNTSRACSAERWALWERFAARPRTARPVRRGCPPRQQVPRHFVTLIFTALFQSIKRLQGGEGLGYHYTCGGWTCQMRVKEGPFSTFEGSGWINS
jgi:hypothetical protein